MKIEPLLYFLFINFGSSLTKHREKLQEIQKLNRQAVFTQEFIPTCQLKDIPMPKNGKEWSCERKFTDSLTIIPKNTKCTLLCEDGYEVKNRKFAFFWLLTYKMFSLIKFF